MKKFLLLALILIAQGGGICAQSDPNLIEITQENVETGYTAATKNVGAEYTTYTATGGLQFAIKTLNVDVTDCDYVIIKFAEPVPSGWVVAFWEDNTNEVVAEGSTEYKLVFSEDTHKDIGVKNNKLPQITLMTRPWGEVANPTIAKVIGVYKHYSPSASITISDPANLIEIDQTNEEGYFNKATKTSGEGYTTYTTIDEGINVAIKNKNNGAGIDVNGCDYVIVKFAEPIPAKWAISFWTNNDFEGLAENATEYKYIFETGPHKDHGVNSEGFLPEVTLMTNPYGGPGTDSSIKVTGIYLHKDLETSRTYSFDKALNFTGTGLEAYVITAFDKDNKTLTLSRVYEVPANTGLYLVGKDGDYTIPVIASADAIDGNLLKPSGDGTITQTNGTNTNLVLATVGENRGFYPLSEDGNMGENKAYLQLPTADLGAGASFRFIYDDEEPTAIAEVNDTKVADGAWYTINGVKLEGEPTEKGIYIYNGKKVAIQ